MPVYFFTGHENYLKKKEIKKVLSGIDMQELNVADFYEYGSNIYDFIYAAPFIGNKKVGILHFVPEHEEFNAAIKDLPDYTDLYIVTSDFPDQRKKVVKELMRLVEEKEFKKIDESLLYTCISSRLKRLGYAASDIEAVKDVLMDCFRGYTMSAEMDLEQVQKYVDMIAFSGALTEENIRVFAPDSSDYRAFRLSNMLLAKDEGCIEFACRLLEQGEKGIGLLNLIAYQIRICYKAVLFSKENYLSLIGIRNYQLYGKFADYSVEKYIKIYELLMLSVGRMKKGEDASAVLADCLAESLAVLKEEI